MSKIGKVEVVEQLHEKLDCTKREAGEALNAVLEIVSKELIEGNVVSLVGFGKFWTQERAERTARNPQNGDPIHVPASKNVKFKMGDRLKQELND